MSYECKVLADSISPAGVRLTTLQVTFPRFILAEVNTHRMLSRNSASSRAIPPEKLIARIMEDPFIPETFNTRVKGMGVGVPLVGQDAAQAEEHWLTARDNAVGAAEGLMKLDCDKSRINRLLEPFMWHTAIISGTEFSNFFALRCHPDAQPEFRIIAEMVRDAMTVSTPRSIEEGQWHLPLVDEDSEVTPDLVEVARDTGWRLDEPNPPTLEWGAVWEYWAMVSAGRCARVSFDTHDQYEETQKSRERANRLKTSGHLSPFEHCARPLEDRDYDENYFDEIFHIDGPKHKARIGNFSGWVQMRKLISGEEDFGIVMASQEASSGA